MRRFLFVLCVFAGLAGTSVFGADPRYTLSEYSMNQCSGCIDALKDVNELHAQGIDVRCINVDAGEAAKAEGERLRLTQFPAWRLVDKEGAEIGRWYGAGKAEIILATIRNRFPDESVQSETRDTSASSSLEAQIAAARAAAVEVHAAKTELCQFMESEVKTFSNGLNKQIEKQGATFSRLILAFGIVLTCVLFFGLSAVAKSARAK